MRFILLVIFSLCGFISSAYATDSSLYFHSTSDKIHFVVTDPAGKRTGYDPILNQKYSENIPDAGYGIANDTGDPVDTVNALINNNAVDGIYRIKVIGTVLTRYSLSISYERPLRIPAIHKVSFTDVNKIDNYEFNYNYAAGRAGTTLILTKIVSPSDLLADITIAGKLGYIGNTKFVNELIKEIQAIEKGRTAVRKPEEGQGDKEKEHLTSAQKAIKEYKELLKEITEKYQRCEKDEFVKKEAYTVLKEDLDYIISHVQ